MYKDNTATLLFRQALFRILQDECSRPHDACIIPQFRQNKSLLSAVGKHLAAVCFFYFIQQDLTCRTDTAADDDAFHIHQINGVGNGTAQPVADEICNFIGKGIAVFCRIPQVFCR